MKTELTEIEFAVLKVLQHMGYKYIARDMNKDLWVYAFMPDKYPNIWNSSIENKKENLEYVRDRFQFVKWEDEKPCRIKELLNEKMQA